MKKLNMIIPIAAVIVILVGAGCFYGGMKYGQSKSAAGINANGQRFAQNGAAGNFRGTGASRQGQNGNMASGEILSKDDKSITVKLASGGSKIVFLSDKTEIGKFTTGAAADLEVGKNVMASGTTNSDGSITATSIQLRPDNQGAFALPQTGPPGSQAPATPSETAPAGASPSN